MLVIGAGVAGSAAAIRFAHRGNSVTLVEKATFPREKICGCCLGAAGLQALDAVGLGDGVRQRAVATNRFVGFLQTQSSSTTPACAPAIGLPLPPGVAVSRGVLDAFLLEQAVGAGVRLWQPYEAQVVASEGGRTELRYRHTAETQPAGEWRLTDEFELVVVATGLSGKFSGGHSEGAAVPSTRRWQLPWIRSPHGPLGMAAHLPGDHSLADRWKLEAGEIQMVCGDEGYVGLVRLPGGAIDIAAALRTQKQIAKSGATDRSGLGGWIDALSTTGRLISLLRSHPDLSGSLGEQIADWLGGQARLMTAPPLRRSRWPGRDRVVAIGDCAGYVEPMTGEGMTWGIESGLAVADLWACSPTRTDFAHHWAARLQGLQRKRRFLCGSVTRAMRSRGLRRAAHVGLTRAPWLAMPITRGLAGGPPFTPTARKML